VGIRVAWDTAGHAGCTRRFPPDTCGSSRRRWYGYVPHSLLARGTAWVGDSARAQWCPVQVQRYGAQASEYSHRFACAQPAVPSLLPPPPKGVRFALPPEGRAYIVGEAVPILVAWDGESVYRLRRPSQRGVRLSAGEVAALHGSVTRSGRPGASCGCHAAPAVDATRRQLWMPRGSSWMPRSAGRAQLGDAAPALHTMVWVAQAQRPRRIGAFGFRSSRSLVRTRNLPPRQVARGRGAAWRRHGPPADGA
jgi:hypothetical protein